MDIQRTPKTTEESHKETTPTNDILGDTNTTIANLLTEKKGNLTNDQYVEYVELESEIKGEDSGDGEEEFYDEETLTRKELRLFYLQCLLNDYSPQNAIFKTQIEMSELKDTSISIDEIVKNKNGASNEEEGE